MSAYSDQVLADNPLLYWRMHDRSGTNVLDSSGNARHGTSNVVVNPTASLLLGDVDNGSLDFQKDRRVSLDSASWMDVTNVTVEAWIEADTTNSAGAHIAGRADDAGALGDSRRSIKLFIAAAGEQLAIILRFTNGTGLEVGVSTPLFGQRVHAVVTWDGTWARLYKNGVEIYSSDAHAGKVIGFPARPFTVGQDAGGYATTCFDGRIDEVAYYGTALSAARVLAHYTVGSQLSSPPSALAGVRARPLDAGLWVTWTPRADATLGYEYRIAGGSPVAVAGASTRQVFVNGLTNGAPVAFEMRGLNELGAGPWSTPIVSTPAVPYVYDLFDRTPIAPSTTAVGTPNQGGPWTQPSGQLGIIAPGHLYPVGSGENFAISEAAYNVDIESRLAGLDHGIIFRYRSTAAFLLWSGRYLYRCTAAGTYAIIYDFGVAPAVGSVLRLRAVGEDVSMWIDGVLRGRMVDTLSLSTDTKVGIRLAQATSRVDYYLATAPRLAELSLEGRLAITNTDLASAIPLAAHVYKGRNSKSLDTGSVA